MTRPVSRSSAVALLLVAAACSDPVSVASRDAQPRVRASLAGFPDSADYTGEAAFRAISRRLPAFAGFYFDSAGRVIVRLTDTTASEAAVALVRAATQHHLINGRRQLRAADAPFHVTPAEFSFATLADWRQALTQALRVEALSFSTDVDEARNRLVVGVTEPAVAADVMRLAVLNSIPEQAVLVEVFRYGALGDPISEADPAPPAGTLTSRVRPVRGGMQIVAPQRFSHFRPSPESYTPPGVTLPPAVVRG